MRIPVFTLPVSLGPLPYRFIFQGLTFFSYQIKLYASSCSVTTFYNYQTPYPDFTCLLSYIFSGISPFLYIFPFGVASDPNLFKLIQKLYLHSNSIFSDKDTIILHSQTCFLFPLSSTLNQLQNPPEFLICISSSLLSFLFHFHHTSSHFYCYSPDNCLGSSLDSLPAGFPSFSDRLEIPQSTGIMPFSSLRPLVCGTIF